MKRTVFTAIAIVASAFSTRLCAENYDLTLEQSIVIAKEKSYTMQNLMHELKIAEYNLQSAKRQLKTHVDMELTLPSFDQTVRQYADVIDFYTVHRLTLSSGLTINQPLPTDGNIFVQSGLAAYRDYYDGNTITSNLNTRIGFRQPLDLLYGYSSIRVAIKNAELAYERANKTLQRNELSMVAQVSNSYYNLLMSQKSSEIARMNLDRQTEAYEISKNKYEAGLIREVDALQMEVDLAEAQSNYDAALLSQNSSTNSFKELIGIELSDSVSLSSELIYKPVFVDADHAVQLALDNRTELREEEIAAELILLDVKRQQLNGRIRGNFNAYIEKVGTASSTTDMRIPNSVQSSYEHFMNAPVSYGVGFTVSIPIFDWGENRSLVRAAQTRYKQSLLSRENTRRDIETEVRNLAANVSSSLKRLQLLEKNIAVAEKSFEITLQRYTDGDIDSQALALERNRLNTARTSHLSAYISYQMALTNLMRATFYDFSKDAPAN
ncbi:MAG: TolC family protein [Candidatus Symbiothrix sp.]|jgi:outer membrane protein TolC|nr:TolC family protein [Candidatus Symbiothrix sp.]